MEKREALIKSAALEAGIHPKVGKEIVNSLFKQLRESAKENKNFRIINLGIFYGND